MVKRSLDAIERAVYRPAPSPMDGDAQAVELARGAWDAPAGRRVLSLDGAWDMVEGGDADRVYGEWEDVIAAHVPGGVHAALIEAGRIPDPTVAKNDETAREKSGKFWWFRRRFALPEGFRGRLRLEFGGVCDRCMVWMNGLLLGGHQGMFGGPEFDVTDVAAAQNELMVMLYPAPYRVGRRPNELNPFFDQMNIGWIDTTVFNCVYGWHYANIPALGIWRSVRLVCLPEVEIVDPFVAARDIHGRVDLAATLSGPEGGFRGALRGCVRPLNFDGPAYRFECAVDAPKMRHGVHLRLQLPEPRLWWPNGLGEQNLYRMELSFSPEGGAPADAAAVRFGVRTIEMAPGAGGPDESTYNWQFVVNGRPIFVKGANWCTIDYAMRFDAARYERFLSLARDQHLQLLRAWGGGMPETEAFYELCDRYGIMVLQEFATAWDSQKVQPADVLREGVTRTVKRLRSHPSLAMWGGGNESARPTDAVIDMMGRIAYELDGTRVFHRNDPWGGSSHNYSVYWGRQDLDYNLSYAAPFIGEFGFASSPNIESARRYIPADERGVWPPREDGSVYHHTPVFNQKDDMAILRGYIPTFLPDDSLENMVVATQLCQVTALRHTLELARTRRPEATGVCYYKLTDVFPAVSWSTIDYYGVPKMAYHFIKHSFAPLSAVVLLNTLNPMGQPQSLNIWLLDDADELRGAAWQVDVAAYDGALLPIRRERFGGEGGIGHTRRLGAFELDAAAASSAPLLITVA
ncbi:MAG: beta-mannosidase, partial [Clostridiales bacterium]|nr:beta-mannosidase [Clostridiales bacterium]